MKFFYLARLEVSDSDFYKLLRNSWIIRAEQFFDSRSEKSYIFHDYKSNYLYPYTNWDPNIVKRRKVPPKGRNQPASESEVKKLLKIHYAGYSDSNGDICYINNEIFSRYDRMGMTSEEYYFENHLSQFYRIIFYFLELQARGIRTDKDDTQEGRIPFDRVPEEIQAIIYDDNAYNRYLRKQEDNPTNVGGTACSNKGEDSLLEGRSISFGLDSLHDLCSSIKKTETSTPTI